MKKYSLTETIKVSVKREIEANSYEDAVEKSQKFLKKIASGVSNKFDKFEANIIERRLKER